MTFKEFIKELNGNRVEGQLVKTMFISLITSIISLSILYFLKLRYIEDFIPKYGFFIFFSILSYALIIPSIIQIKTHKEFPCMSGMMIGMTIGMISGFLTGFYVGATNGMFWGSVFGMAIGISLGILNGKCCGIMGIMEGMMAGFMGGLMGAMTAIMMYNDNLKAAGVIVFAISALIMISLNFMIYKETRESEAKYNEGQIFTIFWSFVLTTLTTFIMVFGPRSLLFQ